MKSHNVVDKFQHGIEDMDIDAAMPAEEINDSLSLLGTTEKKKKASKSKSKSEAHEAVLPDPRVQSGEAIVMLASLSSPVGRISILKILNDLSISEDDLASPLSLIVHTGMVSIVPNVRHPMNTMDYDVQLTEKGKSLAHFLISAEQDRIESALKKKEAKDKEPKKKALSSKTKSLFVGAKKPKSESLHKNCGRHQAYDCHV